MTTGSRSWLAVPVLAFGVIGSGPLLAQQNPLPTKDLIDQLVIDIDQDGIPDRIFLVAADGFADLVPFRGMKDANTGTTNFTPLQVAKEFAFGKPWFKAKAKGVFTVGSANAQTRNKWEETLTLAWRAGRLMVIGVTFTVFDSLSDRYESRNCDLNLSTGRGVANSRPVRIALKPVPVEAWSDVKLPDVCLL